MSAWDKIPEAEMQETLDAIAEEKARIAAGQPSQLRPFSDFRAEVLGIWKDRHLDGSNVDWEHSDD